MSKYVCIRRERKGSDNTDKANAISDSEKKTTTWKGSIVPAKTKLKHIISGVRS